MALFEVLGWPSISNYSSKISLLRCEILCHLSTSKVSMIAAKRWISTFDPPFNAPRIQLSSAYQISSVRHTYDRVASIL